MTRPFRASLCLASSVFLWLGTPASARDAARVQRIAVGRGSALAACEGLDASNGNRARSRFPSTPELTFRTRLAGGIGQAPASDAHGNLIVAHAEPRLSKLDAKGRTLWSERLASEASSAPVLTSAGSILIVTRDGEALLYSTAGKLQAKRALPFADPRRRSLSIPTSNGGALLANGSELFELDENGALLRQLRASGNLSTIAEANAALIAVSDNGRVQIAHATGDLTPLGSFAGNVAEGAAVSAGKLFAVVDGHKWCSLDLTTGQVVTLASEPNINLTGPVAMLDSPSAALVADGGFVSLRAKDGAEGSRAALSATSQGFDPALRGLRAALVVSDQRGAIAAVRSGNDALILPEGKSALRLDDTSCLDPFRPTPTATGIVFACRSGQLFGVSDKAR
ncbi:MAG TPA: PQQ-binding-like beta-propeller repeat protein [Polyangiaceae bacterium]|nr:PQQ-binding-like beta-propeller repeat protein [Polyangiaceae bacterium]